MNVSTATAQSTADLKDQLTQFSAALSAQQRAEFNALLSELESQVQSALRRQTEATSVLFGLIDLAQ